MNRNVFVLNGPNLNLLGHREPGIYGNQTLEDVEKVCLERATLLSLNIDFRQSNHEGTLVDWIQEASDKAGGIVINAAAYTHTSIAILDALKAFDGPIVEVHFSNVFSRENFRHQSFISDAADGVIAGLGNIGYLAALDFIASRLENAKGEEDA